MEKDGDGGGRGREGEGRRGEENEMESQASLFFLLSCHREDYADGWHPPVPLWGLLRLARGPAAHSPSPSAPSKGDQGARGDPRRSRQVAPENTQACIYVELLWGSLVKAARGPLWWPLTFVRALSRTLRAPRRPPKAPWRLGGASLRIPKKALERNASLNMARASSGARLGGLLGALLGPS